MEVELDETLKHRIEEVDETPHDAEAMEMQGKKRARKEAFKEVVGEVDGESLEGGWANLQERELLASRRRNSM